MFYMSNAAAVTYTGRIGKTFYEVEAISLPEARRKVKQAHCAASGRLVTGAVVKVWKKEA